jgi:hypothetical protein
MDNGFDFGLKDYPIFNEGYRNTLNRNILEYYLEEEIGFETPALFKRYLNNRMRLIMPKYKAMYSSIQEILENPTSNMSLHETFKAKGESSGNSNSTSESSSKNNSLFQDTPQGSIKMQDLDSNQVYATNFSTDKNNSNINTNTDSSSIGTNEYVKSVIGNSGNKYNIEIMEKITTNLKSIDQLIIEELSNLFMGIF